jgi:translation initiation factor 4A
MQCDNFDDMELKLPLLRGIYAKGFETPSAVQARCILPTISGRDIIVQENSGCGKTACFSIATLQRLEDDKQECQAIILSPTRELAIQTHKVISEISQYMNVNCTLCIGRTDMKDCIREAKTTQIVIGTPGRITDMISSGNLDVSNLKMFVLDEADDLLSLGTNKGQGFLDQTRDLFQLLPATSQIALFSATMPPSILELTQNFMNDPLEFLKPKSHLTLEGIKQYYINVEKENFKFDTLIDLYSSIAISQAIIYVNTKKKIMWLKEELEKNDYAIACIHGDMDQQERNEIMYNFRNGNYRILITTNLLSRGIDIQQISLVINYDLPNDKESYIHRIGRSGRFGRKGVAVNFVTNRDVRTLRDLENFYHTQIEELPANLESIFL